MKSKELKKKFEQKFKSSENDLTYNEIPHRDHYMYEIFYKKKFIGMFKISRGSKEFGTPLIGIMARTLGINSSQMKGIVSCSFHGKEFITCSRLIH